MCICTTFKLINSGYKIVLDYMEEEKILERCEDCFHAKWTKDECRICRDGIPLPTASNGFVVIDTDIRPLDDGKYTRRNGLLTKKIKLRKLVSIKLKKVKKTRSINRMVKSITIID